MNIFFLDKSPEKSAQYLCDKHVPKMLLESCQMLSSAIQYNAMKTIDELYKPAYTHHPMTKWVGLGRDNFDWTFWNAIAINQEYKSRFGKQHKSFKILKIITDNNYIECIRPENIFSEPPQCMPDEYKDDDYVNAYRKYYQGAKAYFAKWEKGRQQPDWWQ